MCVCVCARVRACVMLLFLTLLLLSFLLLLLLGRFFFIPQFHLILDVAVGGDWFKQRYRNAPYPQPWADNSPYKMMQFWQQRHLWETTWQDERVAMQVKSVKMMQYVD